MSFRVLTDEEKLNTDSMVPVRISVRNLVEFILRSGDLDNRFSGRDADAMQEGSRLHRKIQKSMPSGYKAEVGLDISVLINSKDIPSDLCSSDNSPAPETQEDIGDILLTIEGRADGIDRTDDTVCIDEIKCSYSDVDLLENPIEVHKAQAMCYAYIVALTESLDSIDIQMTYCSIETEKIKRFRETYSFEEIKSFFNNLINAYSKWVIHMKRHGKKRNESIKKLSFPFPYREGQRDLVAGVLSTLKQGKKLFIEAPTGVGKTMSTVFPAVWQIGAGQGEKIFYLTAKTIARTVAEEAFAILIDRGMDFLPITITSKEKLCMLEKPDCNPVACPRAKGHLDRVNDAVYELITKETAISRDIVLRYAEKHNVCPFEMMLDASLFADAVICDYNYAFDPNVKLKRFFADEKKHPYFFLIDEAHNLVERAREMYSAVLVKEDVLAAKRGVPEEKPFQKLRSGLDAVNKSLLAMKRECDSFEIWESVDTLSFALLRVMSAYDDLPRERQVRVGEQMRDLYLQMRHFLNMHELMDENYMIYSDYSEQNEFRLKLQCMDPSVNLKSCLQSALGIVFFSATLLPVKYYMEQLGGDAEDYAVYAPSPFKSENRLILIGSDVSTKYTRRTSSEYEKIYNYIAKFVSAKPGNYMVFFPSYKMMTDVAEFEDGRLGKLMLQESKMSEADKEEFLAFFNTDTDETHTGFCVLGGIFGEGIDLRSDRLIGAVVVGTGLPMVCNERELFRGFYDRRNNRGFDYAYLYPGMNKVLQAAGRVIRTMDDRGAILLLDERFLDRSYQALFPKEWYPYSRVNLENISDELASFWSRQS